jgi:hypothetical protein
VCLRKKKAFIAEVAEDAETEGASTEGSIGSIGSGEEGLEDLGTVVEDAADVGGDEEAIDEGAAEDGVVDVIGDLSAPVLRDEAVFVAPEAIGTVELFVDKAVRRVPGGDFAFPVDGDAVEAEFVADVRAGFHDDGVGSDDLKFEEGWSEAFEVVSVGEEWEDFVDGAGEEDGAVDGESFHVGRMIARIVRARTLMIGTDLDEYTFRR